jgi:DeoR/GlpR family transcriptional regulator of sugar metabolism
MAAAAADNDVTLVGREVDNRTLTLRSRDFEAELKEFYFDAAVLEVDGVDEKNLWVARKNHGFLPHVLGRSDSFVAIARSPTLGRKGDRVAGPLNRADLIVIDRGASEEARKALSDTGLEVRVAGSSEGEAYGLDRVGNVFVFRRTPHRFGAPAHARPEDAAREPQ